ncbi:suppressor of fused domain protein [Oceanobacillus jeddahense]|uniref:suppressor of fused domain protein n=1 Tax=Oceanobacillus jeddahense TaxID=1462527 RepID=UPI0005961F57|nr:suppressor of fused domain protein [Oceanobacillus jeddahense]
MSEEVKATGWDAIDRTMEAIYGEQEPKHYGTLVSYVLGGPDPLDGISAYKSETPESHWHMVTYGFSEIYEKESDNPEVSGFGFELTFRLKRKEGEEEPPAWALNLLQNMGRYVFNSGNVFRNGDYMDANGPICLESNTKLTALAFMTDPELGTIETENGQVQFLQMIGITDGELEAMQTWNTLGVLSAGAAYMPGSITDLERESFLNYPDVSKKVDEGREREGSNTGFLFNDNLSWLPEKKGLFRKKPAMLTLGAKQTETISKVLRGRILKGKGLTLAGPHILVVIEPGEKSGYTIEKDKVQLILDDQTAVELSEKLIPKESVIELSSCEQMVVKIVKTHIKDNEGNVVQVIG